MAFKQSQYLTPSTSHKLEKLGISNDTIKVKFIIKENILTELMTKGGDRYYHRHYQYHYYYYHSHYCFIIISTIVSIVVVIMIIEDVLDIIISFIMIVIIIINKGKNILVLGASCL